MSDKPTVAMLHASNAVTLAQIDAAVFAYLGDLKPSLRTIAEGVALDVGAAVERDVLSKFKVNYEKSTDAIRVIAVRTAILMARPAE
ncbi:hypothetical protein [Methylobacterium sp. WSM2598]|uniref:hypothetical protein n=1 Tax=Methylobacterium sp. WSM2598 TaxID=398261 RepID=UPI000369DA83|nr:hypothetical protein [Methylobacterium sp. WSM2598]